MDRTERTVTVTDALVAYARQEPGDGSVGLEAVVFADAEQTESFEIQKTIGQVFSETDLRFGMDGYCIASNTVVGAVYHDPIREWTVVDGVARFVLGDKGAEVFEGRTWVFECQPDQLTAVLPAIERLVGPPGPGPGRPTREG